MAKNNGHWYTDKNGNHYFVEDGQSPKEGWEASKRRKMISGGKYMTSEDGNEYSEVDKDKYDAYEADEADFDENVDDDFGFDEEDDYEDNFEWSEAEERQIDKYAEHYGADANAMKKSIYAKAQEYMKGDNMGDEEAYDKAMEEVLDEVANGEYNREMKKAQEQNAAMSEGQKDDALLAKKQEMTNSPEFKKIQQYAERLKWNDADSPDGYLTHDEYNDVVAFAAKYNLSEEELKEMGFSDYSGGIIDQINNSKRNQQQSSERKYIRYPNGQIRWKDEIYPDEGALEDIAGQDALKEIVDANDEENEERNFENEIEKRFSGWRPHWTNRKKMGGAHFEHDAFLNSFDYDSKVYKNTDERIKWNRDMADYYRKNGQENAAKEYEDNANFIEKNKDRFAKYEKQANDSRGRRWLQLQGENARISELKRGLRDGKYTVEDLMKYLKGE